MRKYLVAAISLCLALAAACPAYAATKYDSVVDPDKTGTLTIGYADDADGTEPVVGAEFTVYKIAELGDYGNYVPIVPKIKGKTEEYEKLYVDGESEAKDVYEEVLLAYKEDEKFDGAYTAKVTTDEKGTAVLKDLPLGLYLAEESAPAEKHFASIPFLFAVPYTEFNVWKYDLEVHPKALPAGELVVAKSVYGNAGEKDREFHFRVTFDTKDTFDYIRSDGAEGKVKNGDTLALKDGQYVFIDMIPVGVKYTVTEVEANKDGYTTKATGTTGTISKKQSAAEFENTKNKKESGGNSTSSKSKNSGGTIIDRIKTGDTLRPIVWTGIALLAIAAIVIAASRKKEGRK